jgi:hypothetical protein
MLCEHVSRRSIHLLVCFNEMEKIRILTLTSPIELTEVFAVYNKYLEVKKVKLWLFHMKIPVLTREPLFCVESKQKVFITSECHFARTKIEK